MASMRRFHQLTGPGNKKNIFAFGSSIQYYFTDIPIKTQISGKKYVSAVEGVKLTYVLDLTSYTTIGQYTPIVVTRDDIQQMIIAQLQVDGSLLGTLVSAAHNKPGILDTVDYLCNGGHMEAEAYAPITFTTAGQTIRITHEVFIPFSYYGCKSPGAMAPMATWIKPANLKIDSPSSLDPSYGITAVTGTVTASAYMLWRDEIILPPGFQMTRFKSTAATSTAPNTSSDTIDLKSFGQNSTLTGVEQRAAIAALLWGSSDVSGDGKGAGPVNSITDMSALFAGIEQTNDINPIIKELICEFRREAPLMFQPFSFQTGPISGISAIFPSERRYPLWCAEKSLNLVGGDNVNQQPINPRPRFLPIFPPRRACHISKMPIADSSPSYNLTGTFGPQSGNDGNNNPYLSGTGDHYSYMWGIYQWQLPQAAALIAALATDDVGRFLYPASADANNLQPMLKLNKKNPTPINISKATFLPQKLLPASMVADMNATPVVK
jgi:hypothetical protein